MFDLSLFRFPLVISNMPFPTRSPVENFFHSYYSPFFFKKRMTIGLTMPSKAET